MSIDPTNNDSNAAKVVFFKRHKDLTKIVSIPQKSKKRKDDKGHDIFKIHDQILTILNNEFEELPKLHEKLEKLDWIRKNSDDDLERQIAAGKYKNLFYKINLIESGHREAKYRTMAEPLLEKYSNILSQPIRVNFMGNRLNDQNDQKKSLIIEYLSVAKDYVHVQPVTGQKRTLICSDCNLPLQKAEDLLFVCSTCGYFIKHFASVASYQGNDRINVAQRYVYDKRAHFGDSIKKYQSKQNTTIPDQVYVDLRAKIKNHDIPIEKLSKDHLYEFLRLTKHSDHYEDINLIYCELTGLEPNNISHLEKRLFELFDEVDPVYERIKPPGRVNFLNGQFVLFKLLQKLKHPCREEDFYILKTREKMLEHDQMWKRICKELEWTYIATV